MYIPVDSPCPLRSEGRLQTYDDCLAFETLLYESLSESSDQEAGSLLGIKNG